MRRYFKKEFKICFFFGNVDKKLRKLGFIKFYDYRGNGRYVLEDEYGVVYKRQIKSDQVLSISIRHKNGKPLIKFYKKDDNIDKSNNIELNYDEMKLIMKKYRQMKHRYKWR